MKRLILALSVSLASLACSKEGSECIETVNTNCICTYEYAPVCGCNEKTYGNACEAECAGITEYTVGVCPE